LLQRHRISHFKAQSLWKNAFIVFSHLYFSLVKRNEEMQDAKDKKADEKAKAKMPPGTRLMGEEERIATLEELQKNRL